MLARQGTQKEDTVLKNSVLCILFVLGRFKPHNPLDGTNMNKLRNSRQRFLLMSRLNRTFAIPTCAQPRQAADTDTISATHVPSQHILGTPRSNYVLHSNTPCAAAAEDIHTRTRVSEAWCQTPGHEERQPTHARNLNTNARFLYISLLTHFSAAGGSGVREMSSSIFVLVRGHVADMSKFILLERIALLTTLALETQVFYSY